jgi:quercetin 2,3-dioxygenase
MVAAGTTATACSRRTPPPGAEPAAKGPALADPVLSLTPLTTSGSWQTRDPFLFCVHHDDAYPVGNEQLGPSVSLEGRRLGQDFEGKDGWRMYHGRVVPGFPRHPHRGFETVTVVRRGLLDHSDSMGAAARYGEGDVQWLTAGNGIQHAEMFPLLRRDADNPLELFQLWLNLPRASKRAEPHFSMLWKHLIPTLRDSSEGTVEVTIVAGRHAGLTAPAPPPSSWAATPGNDVAIWTIRMSPGASWTLPPAPAGVNRTLYFFRGSALRVGAREIPPRHQMDLRPDAEGILRAGAEPTELLLLQGRPIGEPVVQHGPFVMNTTEEIQEAYRDYRITQFGGWPWKGSDPVHGTERARFARHADGHVERPG